MRKRLHERSDSNSDNFRQRRKEEKQWVFKRIRAIITSAVNQEEVLLKSYDVSFGRDWETSL